MSIQTGEKLPAATLYEFVHEESEGCSIGPQAVPVQEAAAGKKIALFALPGAYTPTCSAKHVPGFVALAKEFAAKGVDEIWCVSVNDAFVMGAWGKELGAIGVVRMLGDGSAEFTKKLGMELDLTTKGLGVRSQRYSMLVNNGVVEKINLDAGGAFEKSTAE
ncbi:MAG: peroxiredoxin, partial [Limnobacter sp.]|nr:peroxiredoxin [Limnobacter sp.]